MESPFVAPSDPQLQEDEEFEQEKVVREAEDFCYYIRQSTVVLIFKLLFVQLVVIGAQIVASGTLYLSQSNGITATDFGMGSSITAIVVIQCINLIATIFLTLHWVKTIYVIRPKSITEHTGIVAFVENEYSTERVESVNVKQSIFGKIFNYGTIQIFSPVQKADFNLEDIPHPYTYAHIISKHPTKDTIRFIPHREGNHP